MLDDLDDIHPLFHGAPATTEFKKLRKRIVRETAMSSLSICKGFVDLAGAPSLVVWL